MAKGKIYEGFTAVYPPKPMQCEQAKIMRFEFETLADPDKFLAWRGSEGKLYLWLSLDQVELLHRLTGEVLGIKTGR